MFFLDELPLVSFGEYSPENSLMVLQEEFPDTYENCRIEGLGYPNPTFQERTERLSSQSAQTSHYPVVRAQYRRREFSFVLKYHPNISLRSIPGREMD